jgi:enoyl-CoA hydratase
MTQARLVYERAGDVAKITLDNQAAHNALTAQMWYDLRDRCLEIAKDRSIRVVTFRGAGGKAFISGTDISGFTAFTSGEDGLAYETKMDGCIAAVEALPQPTVAVIEGWAVGGGLAISTVCDFRIATPTAKFGSPLARTIGNCVSAKGYARLIQHVGIPLVKRMVILGDMLTGQELLNLGFVLNVVEQDGLDAAVDELCGRLAAMAPLTIKVTKEAMLRLTYSSATDMDDLITEIYGSNDFRNGVRNFLDKKPQKWTGT